MSLIINKFALLSYSFDGHELSAADSEASGEQTSAEEVQSATKNNHKSCLRHNLVDESWIRLHFKVSIFVDADEARKEGFSGNTVLGEAQISIVNTIVANFGANISYFHSW